MLILDVDVAAAAAAAAIAAATVWHLLMLLCHIWEPMALQALVVMAQLIEPQI